VESNSYIKITFCDVEFVICSFYSFPFKSAQESLPFLAGFFFIDNLNGGYGMSESEDKVRVTLVMPRWLDREIEIMAAETGQPKNVVVTSALTASLPPERKRTSHDSPRKHQRARSAAR
jgi:hypothetical protein